MGCLIQVEILLAQDGVPVVSQNPNLKRLTGVDKSVKDFSADALPPLLPRIRGTFQVRAGHLLCLCSIAQMRPSNEPSELSTTARTFQARGGEEAGGGGGGV